MKFNSISKIWVLALCISITFISSCQKALDINVDPNKSPTATPALVLPAAQVGMAITIGNWNYTGCMWAQYWTGGQGVGTANLEKYNMTGTDVETGWNHAYSKTLADLDFLIRSDQPIYSGMGKIMSAYLYQMLADLFGDVPFSEALKGAPEDGGILAPKFDRAEDIYPALLTMLDEGITAVQTTGALVKEPGTDDLIYGGDIDNWVAFANTVKLKILVRQGNKNADALDLMTRPGVSFIDESNHATVQFTESTRNANPIWTRFSGSGLGMYYVAATASIDTLLNVNGAGLRDPRIDKLYLKPTAGTHTFEHIGILSGEVNTDPQYELTGGQTAENRRKEYSNVGAAVYNFNIPIYFVSAWESKFLQAEVIMKSGGDASTLFNEGVQASFNILGIGSAAPAYLTSLGYSSSDPLARQLEVLGLQKWISMNGLQMIEGWLESVRFDKPAPHIFTGPKVPAVSNSVFTNPSQNVLGSRIFPTSFVYPTQEVANNPNTPAGRVVTDKRFWNL